LLVNTHLHSDHCGGNAAVQRAWPCPLRVPPGHFQAAQRWDEAALSYRATGQQCERFTPDSPLQPGQQLAVGGRQWQALAAPGHDPHSIMLFDATHGALISADALWEHGFGVVFPELEGEQAFDEVAASLDLIESLRPAWVIPGHGRPFQDATGALQRARQRLAGFVADPARHSRHALRVLVKYHLMELRRQPWPELLAWFEATPLCQAVWQRLGQPTGSLRAFGEQTARELLGSGALAQDEGCVLDVG
jgi:glyoxylase-like metal-dependent hydrolase (beta-lactamase superfamily II)